MAYVLPTVRQQLSLLTQRRNAIAAARYMCSSASEPESTVSKSLAEQNEERARMYLQRYSSQGDAVLKRAAIQPAPLRKKSIPVVTGDVPDVNVIAKQLEDEHGAHEVSTMDVRAKAPFVDWMVVCCGRTERHVLAIADGIKDDMRRAGVRVGGDIVGICGRDDPEWMAVDIGPVVVHVMTDQAREHYDLEGLWMPERVIDADDERKMDH